MTEGGAWLLFFFILLFSGIWPYVKLGLMLYGWYANPKDLSIGRRQSLLVFLDAFGKWSLVDNYVLVLSVVGFKFNIAGLGPRPAFARTFAELGESEQLKVVVEHTWAFHCYIIATLCSLFTSHIMSACHRYAPGIGEFAIDVESAREHKQALCYLFAEEEEKEKE